MKYLAAYALLVLGGNSAPKSDDIKKVLSEVGCTTDNDQLNALLTAMKGKSLHEVISAGLSLVPSSAPVSATKVEVSEVKKEEKPKVEEKKEEEIDLGGAMDMFGAMDA